MEFGSPKLNSGFMRIFIILLITLIQCFSAKAQIITNVKVVDGTGSPYYWGSVRIQDGKIAGTRDIIPKDTDSVIDGKGLVLAPGFIDAHSHHWSDLREDSGGLPVVSQGITTIVIGQDGFSYPTDSLKFWMERNPAAVNVATFTGHSGLREAVMGANEVFREASAEEIGKMKELLQADLEMGSLGLSTGLEYEQAYFSSTEEVIELARVAGSNGGKYISHIRSEDIALEDAVLEIIKIGAETGIPVQLTHIKIGMASKWGTASEIIQKLEKARLAGIEITADIYPYNYWNSTLRVLFPKRDYDNPESAAFAVRETLSPEESYLVAYAPIPEYAGQTIGAISRIRNETPDITLMALIRIASEFQESHPDFEGDVETIVAKGMADTDIEDFMAWRFTGICSDGNAGGHPRGFGAFPRILAKYVRDTKLLTLEQAVHKMTGLTANNLGLEQKGYLRAGYDADLVLFNPDTVQDNASISNPHALSDGIEAVWVSGELVYKNKQTLGVRPGKLITRSNIIHE
ncbi:D-aminoacylase [Robiginitalea sp.]|nr:D-aminoacylase [Robiginitalea sp.]